MAHRASWEMAFGEIPVGMQVLHRCDNKACVRPDHLFLGTQLDNVRDMHRKGRANKAKGSAHSSSKLTEQQVTEIRVRYAAGGVSGKDLASEFGVSHPLIYGIVSRRAWKHVA